MSGIIQGYEYDIFISYRQKDNKYDGWVTEFVSNLRKELEATFKEEISIYFDENPSDGLLETYDVDKSLEGKLKCLIFIPIISQTYCDPKSFAWQNEFIAFNRGAGNDSIGSKVKLSNGNVTGRILPVKIHDLDTTDKTLLENELGRILRSIDFIFKSPGVNRPLKPDDSRTENLNHTYYRDQINKVANAIKEIINSLKTHSQHELSSKSTLPEIKKIRDKRLMIPSIVVLALIFISLFYFISAKRKESRTLIEKSIAVLPFRNDSQDSTNSYFINGIMDKVLNDLQVIKDLRVISRTSVEQYRKTTKTIPEIGKELGVNYIVEAEGQKFGNKVSINAKLIKVKKENKLWSDVYEQDIKEVKDIFDIQTQIARKIADELKTTITPEENQLIEKTPLTNLTAYDFYQRGRDEYSKYQSDNNLNSLKKSEAYYHQALKYDSNSALAYTGLARVLWEKHSSSGEFFSENYMDSVLILCNIALTLDNKLPEAFTLRGEYYTERGEIQKAIDEYDHALSINPNFSDAYQKRGDIFSQDDEVKSIDNYQKASALNHDKDLPELLRTISTEYWSAGFPDIAKSFSAQALALDGDSSKYFNDLGYFEYVPGNYDKALNYFFRAYSMDTSNIGYSYDIAYTYMFQNKAELALKYFKNNIDTLNFHRSSSYVQLHHLGWALWENEQRKKAEFFFNKQLEYSKNTIQLKRPWGQKLYSYFDIAEVYAFKGDKEKAYKYLNLFNQRETMPVWILDYLTSDPLLKNIRNEPSFQKIEKDIESKYMKEHERVKKWLDENSIKQQ